MGYSHAHANLGKTLEKLIDMTNQVYATRGVADIARQNPEVTVLQSRGNQIIKAFWKEKGMPDYVGIYNGRAIIFDAKETKDANFPLKNLKPHQYKRLKSWHEKGAFSFLVVCFPNRDYATFYLPFDVLAEYWEAAKDGGRKSIPYQTFVERCPPLGSGNGYYCHYLQPIEEKLRMKGEKP